MKRLFCVMSFLLSFIALAFAGNGIPNVQGAWSVNGEGTWGDIRVFDRGTQTITSYIDSDGYEVITQYSYAGTITDASGAVLLNDNYTLTRENLGGGIKITSRNIILTSSTIRYNITIQDDNLMTAKRTGTTSGRVVDADYTFNRTSSGGGSGGGGCAVSTLSPMFLLLLAPLLLKRK